MDITNIIEARAEEKFLNDSQVSALTGLSVQTLRNWRFAGRGPAYTKAGRSVRYALSDILSFMHSRRVEPSREAVA